MRHRSIIVFFFSFLCFSTSLKGSNYHTQLYNLYITGKIAQWQPVITSLQKQPGLTTQAKLDLLEYYYGLIGHLLGKKQNGPASQLLENANAILDDYLKLSPSSAVAYGLKSNFLGYQIALTPMKAPFLIKQMMENSKKAIQLDANNPFVNILRSNILFYMPSMFGGDTQLAMEGYQKALSIWERTPGAIKNNWLYVQLIVTIAVAYEKDEKYNNAKQMLEKAMKIVPNYKYVSQTLYPRVMEKMKS